MKVTVAICTWNRAKLLDQTLAEMRKLRIPDGVEWELLVVNNNCTDDTDAVIARYNGSLPIRRLLETKQGHSNARNCAVDAASGDLLLWTDDDVLVDGEWLAEYANAAVERPDAAFFGGMIEPWFEDAPPDWLRRSLPDIEIAYAVRDLGPQTFYFSPGRIPFGASFAIRTKVQRAFRFDPSLGRKKHGMLGGDETTVINAMLAAGHKGVWLPKARLRHFIPRDRQTIRYLRAFYEAQGFAMQRDVEPCQNGSLFGRPRWLWRAWVASEIRYRLRCYTRPANVWIHDLKQAAMWRGGLRCRVAT